MDDCNKIDSQTSTLVYSDRSVAIIFVFLPNLAKKWLPHSQKEEDTMSWSQLMIKNIKEIEELLNNLPPKLEEHPYVDILRQDMVRDLHNWARSLRVLREADQSHIRMQKAGS